MTDTTLPPGGDDAVDRIEPVDIQQEMQRSYIDYAMSVIVGRALPEVRDGLKPVHRRVLYAMYDSGFRPDRSHAKSARSVAETMGNYHPHGDASIYDTLVRMAQPWSLRYPLVDGQGNFGSPGNDPAAAMRYTEARLTPLAMEMLREIDEETVDFIPNYDGRVMEPTVLPSRFPNLLANGSGGIAVGMATNMPPHNLRELAEAVYWALDNHEADEETTLKAVCEKITGPDFPTSGLIVGTQGIHDAYTTGRGSIRMRGVAEIEEDSKGRTSLVITELPYQVNHDNFITSIAEQVRDGKIAGISNIEDQSSDRVGLRIVVVLKRDAVAKVVLNNLYKHTQLQTSFGANMLSIVDGVPRTLRLDQLIRLYVNHQLDVIIRRTRYRLRKANERAHILRGLVKALDALDEVIALIRASQTVDIARTGLIELLDVDEIQAQAILDMQLRRLAAAMRYTEARLTPLAMEMLREIDEETVDFIPNYDGRVMEPTVLPSRFPNLLANGSGGIAVGMATNMPPHNLRELAEAVYWALDNHEADEETTLKAVCEKITGPDFPTSGLIVGTQGIHDAYTTGRGSIRMRGVAEIEEDSKGRTSLVITELPYQVNHDNFITSIAEQVRDGKIAGISNIEDQSSDRVGLRIVVVLKRDAVAKVVLNNLYKHTQLQTSFGANMLSIVDGVPRTLRLDQLIRLYVNHQLDVIIRRTRYRLRKANERAHILRGLVKALDALDEVIALIRASQTVDIARTGLIELLDVDEIQAQAILDMQLRRLAALERQKIIDDLAKIEAEIADLEDILAKPERQRAIVKDELAEITEKYGDDRRTRIISADGDVADEDLIAREDVVVTITETGYAKRTKTDLYRSQKRGGKGVQGAGLKQDDIVKHFFVCSTHDWILFFTTKGRVYRAKAYDLPEAARTARGQHVANLLAFQPEERIAQVIQIKSYEDAPYLVLATKNGLVKKSKLTEFDSNRSGGLVAVNLRDGDELVGAVLCSAEDDLLLVSAHGQSIRFSATDEALRPMGRATSGVQGMRFNGEDDLLSLNVVREGTYLLVATSGGYSKRTAIEEYPVQGRGGKGVLTVQYDPRRGSLVGALVVDEESELYAITSGGGVIRTIAKQVRKAGRQTKGVRLMNLGEGDTLLAIAHNADEGDADPDEDAAGTTAGE
ncbi:DNA gyrase (subunit A) GyrA (DNA topoisomerase) [Mycobacteroides abscessus]|nr:DNA gyrase (subunit A) GyrA (DNA topoisomerase) [Mycobacteroides abscessus]